MSTVIIPQRFRVRRRTAASWAALNEVLLDSEIGRESDTDRFKFGPGAWNDLQYAVRDASRVTAVAAVGGIVTLDWRLGDYFTLTLTEQVTAWAISNPPGSGRGFSLFVQITQGAGPYIVAKPGTTAGGAALDVSTAAGAVDLLGITSFNNGTTLRSNIGKAYS